MWKETEERGEKKRKNIKANVIKKRGKGEYEETGVINGGNAEGSSITGRKGGMVDWETQEREEKGGKAEGN